MFISRPWLRMKRGGRKNRSKEVKRGRKRGVKGVEKLPLKRRFTSIVCPRRKVQRKRKERKRHDEICDLVLSALIHG